MENTRTDLSSKANQLSQDFKNKVMSSEKNLGKMSHEVGEKMGAMASDIASTTSEYLENGRTFVKENPVSGVAIAAAVGAVAGSIVTLAMRRKQ